MIDFALVARRSGGNNFIHIVEQDAHVAQAADTRIGADRRQAILQTREAENAFLCLVRLPVEINLLVRAGRHAVAPAAAAVLRDEHDAVFFALVDSAGRACRNAGRVQAVVADARQILHEQVMEFRHVLEVDVLTGRLAVGEVVLPVRAPFNFHALVRDERTRAGNRLMVAALRMNQRLVVIRPRLIVIIHLRLVRMIEEL